MQVEIKIDDACRETKIIILTDKMTEEINSLVRKLSAEPFRIPGRYGRDIGTVGYPADLRFLRKSSCRDGKGRIYPAPAAL